MGERFLGFCITSSTSYLTTLSHVTYIETDMFGFNGVAQDTTIHAVMLNFSFVKTVLIFSFAKVDLVKCEDEGSHVVAHDDIGGCSKPVHHHLIMVLANESGTFLVMSVF